MIVDPVATRILQLCLAEVGKFNTGAFVSHEDVDDVRELTCHVGNETVPLIIDKWPETMEDMEREFKKQFRWALDTRPKRRFKERRR